MSLVVVVPCWIRHFVWPRLLLPLAITPGSLALYKSGHAWGPWIIMGYAILIGAPILRLCLKSQFVFSREPAAMRRELLFLGMRVKTEAMDPTPYKWVSSRPSSFNPRSMVVELGIEHAYDALTVQTVTDAMENVQRATTTREQIADVLGVVDRGHEGPAAADKRTTINMHLRAICWATALVSIFLGALLLLIHAPKADWCPTDAAGSVIPSRTVDGMLQRGAGMYFVQRDGGEVSFLPVTYPASRGPHDETWQRSMALVTLLPRLTGKIVHADICGRSILRIDAGGENVLMAPLRTQQDLNAEFNSHQFPLKIMLLICMAAFLGSATLYTLRRKAS